MKSIAQNLQCLYKQIVDAEQKYGRKTGSVTLLAVSKTHPVKKIRAAAEAGQHHFGESYLQEAVRKIREIDYPGLIWHFIGPIQTNKTRGIAENFSWVHSLDRLKIARRLNDMRPAPMPPLNVCIQINISGEMTKSGIEPEQLPSLVSRLSELPRLRFRGLMAMPAQNDDFDVQRRTFRKLREYSEQLQAAGHNLDTLSMGTTGDMEAAIAEGATIVRIGTAIFGPRE